MDQLALNIAAAPGQYLLLLGSGISRSSGIPTGWEVTLDLIRRIATVRGEEVAPDQAAAWFEKEMGQAPRYSEILEMSGPTKQLRQQLIRSYFERQPGESEDNKKPTKAHNAIARLVAAGTIRTIITTNFDRLLEAALQEAGVSPVVIATPAQFTGAGPIHRNACTIIKLHGDYLDPEILNIDSELGAYSDDMNRLLDRLFDEHGLVICGWSADYDIALRAALERRVTRRYPGYWMHVGPVGGMADNLISSQAIQKVQISGADAAFSELESKALAALHDTTPHPISEALSVAEAKRALASPTPLIAYRDLVMRLLRKLEEDLASSEILVPRRDSGADEVFRRIDALLNFSRPLRKVIELGVFYREADTLEIALTVFRRLLAISATYREGYTHLLNANRALPFSFLTAIGLTAVASGNYVTFAHILGLPDPRSDEQGGRVARSLIYLRVVDDSRHLPGFEKHKTGQSDFFMKRLRDEFRELIPDDSHYEQLFDQFEILVGLAFAAPTEKAGAHYARLSGGPWAPVGRFCWRRDAFSSGLGIWSQMKADLNDKAAGWGPLAGGMFFGDPDIAKQLFATLDPFYKEIAAQWRF